MAMPETKAKQRPLLLIHALKAVLSIFTSTFLTSYIVSLNADNIWGKGIFNIGLLYLTGYATYITVYYLLSFFVSKSNRIIFLRLGILVNCVLLTVITFYGQTIAQWIVVAGILYGLGEAFYYASYLVIKNELVDKKYINNYHLASIVATNLVNIIVPTLLGFLIDISTYTNIALYVILLCVLQFVLSFFVQGQAVAKSSFQIKAFVKFLRTDKFARDKIKYTYWNSFLAGFKNTYKILIVILTIYAFATNLSLGILTSVFSVFTILLLALYKKFEYHARLNKLVLYLIISLLPVITCLLFICLPNKACLIAVNLCLTIAIYFSEYGTSCERDAIIKNLHQEKFISEHQFFSEFFIFVGRVIAYSGFIVVGLFANINVFKVLLLVLISLMPIKFWVMYQQTKIRKALEAMPSEVPVPN